LVALKKKLHAGAFAIEGGRAIGAVHRAVEGGVWVVVDNDMKG